MWKDSETNLDYLNLSHIIKVLNEIILDEALTPATIGVYGAWGSGKSSVLTMSEKIISEMKDVLCVKFNSWLFEDYYDIRLALLGTIINELSKKIQKSSVLKSKLKKTIKSLSLLGLMKKAIGYGLDIAFNKASNIIEELVNEDEKSDSENITEETLRENIRAFSSTFEELIKEAKLTRVVVYIDELDRCNPEKIIEVLEAIRLFVFVPGISFVIGADERLIQYAIERKYTNLPGNDVSIGKEYLDKLIQYVIYIPILSMEEMFNYICLLHIEDSNIGNKQDIIECILQKMERDVTYRFSVDSLDLDSEKDVQIIQKLAEIESVSKSLSIIFDLGFQGNPRKCKRFLNNLYMRMKISSIRGLNINVGVLCKLMMLEYFKPEIYKILFKEQVEHNGMSIWLYDIKSEGDDPYILHRKDKWFKQWLENAPSLKGVNLSNYLYVSRSNYKLLSSNISLSYFAEKIYNDLISDSKILEDKALTDSGKLEEDEVIVLFDRLKDYTYTSENQINVIKCMIRLSIQHQILKTKMINFLNKVTKNCGALKFIVDDFKKHYAIEEELTFFDKRVNEDETIKQMAKMRRT